MRVLQLRSNCRARPRPLRWTGCRLRGDLRVDGAAATASPKHISDRPVMTREWDVRGSGDLAGHRTESDPIEPTGPAPTTSIGWT
jgi:hypothetical protein